MTGLGLVLRQTDLIHISHLQALFIYGLNVGWIPRLSECFNAYWCVHHPPPPHPLSSPFLSLLTPFHRGANQVLPIVAKEADAVGALPWQETIVTIAHKGSSFLFIPAMAAIAWELFFGKTHAKHVKHDKHVQRD
jgi:hypothetical protein